MKLGAIITGDIIDSTKLSLEERKAMLSSLLAIPTVLEPIQKDISLEIFRGDGFQIGIIDIATALKATIVVRAWLRSTQISAQTLDARLAVGIGNIKFNSNALATSDGTAFQLSGRLLDNMHKSRIAVETPWKNINDELKLSTAFADAIISSWTKRQSEVMLQNLLSSNSHLEIAQSLNITRQMVDKAIKAAHGDLIKAYLTRYSTIITKHYIQP